MKKKCAVTITWLMGCTVNAETDMFLVFWKKPKNRSGVASKVSQFHEDN